MRNSLRSLWIEPRAPGNPGIVWWDRWLVGAVIVAAFIEAVVRTDLVWTPLAVVVVVVLSFTLLGRRTHPLAMVAIAFAAITISNVVTLIRGDTAFGLYAMAFILVLPYALVRWGSGREIVVGLAMVLVGFTSGIAADYTNVGEAIAAFVFAMSPALMGAAVRYRTHALGRDREQAVMREREQLARELHDTVAHHVSAIAIRAQAGRELAATDPNAPLEALDVIEEEAKKTLTEMRTMVGALRQGEEPELTPRPGVTDIERLAHDVTDGPNVTVVLDGEFADLTPAVDAALYRVAQESITNAIRHARSASSVDVSVSDLGSRVCMRVVDDGEATAIRDTADPGFGLIGMAERSKLLGGRFEAGPLPGRGWSVEMELPKDGTSL